MIDRAHLKIEPYPTRERGGQHVGTGPSGVKITHIPSGLVAISTEARSQHRNREVAMNMILGGLTGSYAEDAWLK